MCFSVGVRASMLTPNQSFKAWQVLAKQIESFGNMDIPKYRDLIKAVRTATIAGKQHK